MRRDTYHDYVTDGELFSAEARSIAPRLARQQLFDRRIAALIERSRVFSTRSGVLHLSENAEFMAHQFAVSFDSRAWTGRA